MDSLNSKLSHKGWSYYIVSGVAGHSPITSSVSGTTRSTPLRPMRASPSSQKYSTIPKKGEGDLPPPMTLEQSIEAFGHLGRPYLDEKLLLGCNESYGWSAGGLQMNLRHQNVNTDLCFTNAYNGEAATGTYLWNGQIV
ncbi:hypothetical protein EJ110_NYTH12258 [Nymphaea thermarum]|nr:hypothetical protein EJ110_NYTH12258 [Nymphaea thermarum]